VRIFRKEGFFCWFVRIFFARKPPGKPHLGPFWKKNGEDFFCFFFKPKKKNPLEKNKRTIFLNFGSRAETSRRVLPRTKQQAQARQAGGNADTHLTPKKR